jgi:signal transduction histidine kinase
MVDRIDYQLIHELFDYIIIFNCNHEIIFEGASAKSIFNNAAIDLQSFISKKSSPNAQSQLLETTFKNFKTNSEPVPILFLGIEEEFILFPLNSDSPQLALAPKDKIVQISKIEHDLKERVKELKCLYRVDKELESTQSLDDFFSKCLKYIQEAFQFPDDVIVNVDVGKKSFINSNFNPKEINSILTSEIKGNNRKYGEIRILFKNDTTWLDEEKNMVDELTDIFARAIEESEKTINLEKQQKILLAKNEALLKMTEECNKKQQKLRTFFSAITANIVVIDHNFEIIMSNRDDIGDAGKCYNKLFGLDERCKECPAIKTFETAENSICNREEDDKFLLLRSYPIFDANGAVERVLEVCTDVTVQKRMEAQLLQSYKLASLGKLVAGVAHEINNPNTFILGNLKIFQEAFQDIFPILEDYRTRNNNLKIARLDYDVFKDNVQTLLNDMINGANRTKKIVGDLRNFAKKDVDTLTDEIDLNYIIKNNLTLTSKHVRKYAELVIELTENIPLFKGSFNKLEQVILNLVMNAAEAVEDGNGLVKIKTDYDEKTKEVLLIVEDNGCGMDENTLKNIFDPFFTTKRNKGGTGLGLSITYGIIKDHSGKIEVESKPGVGTKFQIRFPTKVNI